MIFKKIWLGPVKYSDALIHQNNYWEIATQGEDGFILGCEHAPVVTLGARGRLGEDVLASASELQSKGYELHETRRGGQAVLHQPGQLVIYPILNLKSMGLGVREYIQLLEQISVETLKSFGVACSRAHSEPGLFTATGKIVFVGVHVAKSTTRHGIAINVNNELADFAMIRACGVAGQKMDRLSNYGEVSLNELFESWNEAWQRTFPARAGRFQESGAQGN